MRRLTPVTRATRSWCGSAMGITRSSGRGWWRVWSRGVPGCVRGRLVLVVPVVAVAVVVLVVVVVVVVVAGVLVAAPQHRAGHCQEHQQVAAGEHGGGG